MILWNKLPAFVQFFYIFWSIQYMQVASSYNDVVKDNVLTGFSRFIFLALIAIGINITDSIESGYSEYYDVYVLCVAAVLLLFSLALHYKGYTLAAKIISLLTFNVALFLISIELGIRSATYLYYFPLILVYIYLFRNEGLSLIHISEPTRPY